MAESKHRPKFKVKKKKNNIQKQKLREMTNVQNQKKPVSFTYHKDAQFVKVPIKAWQTLNQVANELKSIAMFVSVMEQVGDSHVSDGILLPIFDDDLEAVPGAVPLPNGQVQKKLKDSFWVRGAGKTFEKPSIVMADGVTVYDESQKDTTEPVTPL